MDSRAIAEMLSEDVHLDDVSDQPEADEFESDEFSEDLEEADEGQLVAVEEMMLALNEQNPKNFLQALRSFIWMTH